MTASALAAPPTPTEKKLQAEVAALQKKIPAMQKQITTLQTQVKTLQKNDKTLSNVLSAEIDYSICSNAATADAIQQTWATINISATGAIFGAAESAVNDAKSCSRGRSPARPRAYPIWASSRRCWRSGHRSRDTTGRPRVAAAPGSFASHPRDVHSRQRALARGEGCLPTGRAPGGTSSPRLVRAPAPDGPCFGAARRGRGRPGRHAIVS